MLNDNTHHFQYAVDGFIELLLSFWIWLVRFMSFLCQLLTFMVRSTLRDWANILIVKIPEATSLGITFY